MPRLAATLLIAPGFLLAGCQGVTIINYAKEGEAPEYYAIVRNPEETFRIYAMELDTTMKATVGTGQVNVGAEGQFDQTVVKLAEQLDQLNSQVLAQYKAAFFGLNSNPKLNREAYWKSLDEINKQIADLRKVYLASAEAVTKAADQDKLATLQRKADEKRAEASAARARANELSATRQNEAKRLEVAVKTLSNVRPNESMAMLNLSPLLDDRELSRLATEIAAAQEQAARAQAEAEEYQRAYDAFLKSIPR